MKKVEYQFSYDANNVKTKKNDYLTTQAENREINEIQLLCENHGKDIDKNNVIIVLNTLLSETTKEYEESFAGKIGCIKDVKVKIELSKPDETRPTTVEKRNTPSYSRRLEVK